MSVATPSPSCDSFRELLAVYVIGALEPEQASEVRTHLGTCSACEAEQVELAQIVAFLDAIRRAWPDPPWIAERPASPMPPSKGMA
ncbi:anti-sigma factor family protein [Kribbella aluminosa]|uniref:anti-sigma factor family protein n=1 Tax=Kribbella aluminosa TaxID=416017 RepID=UPI001AE80B11